jgi:hypothetical protein
MCVLYTTMYVWYITYSNARRLEIRLAEWTKVYVLFKQSTLTNAPMFSRELLEQCNLFAVKSLSPSGRDAARAVSLRERPCRMPCRDRRAVSEAVWVSDE